VNIPNGYEVEENGMNIINHHKPNKPKDPEPKTINPDKSRELDNNKKLPLTGSESGNSLLGLILLGVGTSLVAYKRRKED